MTQPTQTSLDFPYCMELQAFLKLLDEYKGKVVKWVATGPGGGNPCVTLEFPSREECLTYIASHYPDDDHEFWESLID